MTRIGWLLLLFVGCAAEEERVALTLAFESEAAQAEAVSIAVRIVEGSCEAEGDPVARYEIAPGETGMRSPVLPPGRYAVIAEAHGVDCTAFARGCDAQELPSGEPFHVVLAAVPDPPSACGECAYCDGLGGCVEEPGPVCGHEQVVCDLWDGAAVVPGGKKGRFVAGSGLTVCAENAPAVCVSELRDCRTSRFSGAASGHLHVVRFRVHDGDAASAGPSGGGDRIVLLGARDLEVMAQDGTAARGAYVGAAIVDESAGHTHEIMCDVYDVDAEGSVTVAGSGAAFTLDDAGRFCLSPADGGACGAHFQCRVW